MDNQTLPADGQVNQTAQIPQEVMVFLEGILEDAGMTALDKDMHDEMVAELYARLDNYMVGVIIDNMPEEHLETFVKMNEENKPKEEIEKFIQEKMPKAGEVFAGAFAKFRELYLGGIAVARNAPK